MLENINKKENSKEIIPDLLKLLRSLNQLGKPL